MKIAVVGSREWNHLKLLESTLCKEFTQAVVTEFISGGARGVDSYAEKLAKDYQLKITIFKPDWDKYGKSAGYKRNKLIIDEADKVIAFWSGKSKGTKHSIDLAIQAGKPIDIYVRS